MDASMYQITVLIVTYRQENLIGRAIESVMAQKEWGLKNIIIQDDCSPDRNWEVIQEYQKKFPEYIIAYRNETNLGIYGNYDSLINKRGSADLFYILEGDDAICNGWFKAIQENLHKRNINIRGKAAAICSDYKIVRPNGWSLVAKNNRLVEKKGLSMLSLKARHILSFRSVLATSKVMDSFEPVILDKGIGIAEEMADMRVFKYSDEFYYVPFVATIYYTHVGISMKLEGEEYNRERMATYEWVKTLPIDTKAKQYQDYMIAQKKFLLNTNWENFKIMLSAFKKSYDKYTLSGEQKYLQFLNWCRMVKLLLS